MKPVSMLKSIFLLVSLPALALGQAADRFQSDVPPELVQKVDAAKEKQVSGVDLPSAEKTLLEVLKARPDYYRAQFNLGLIYQAEGRGEDAVKTLAAAKQLGDSLHIADPTIVNSLGWAYLNTGKLDVAEKLFLDALSKKAESTPESVQRVLNNLGYLYLQKGDTVTARAYLETAIKEYQSQGAKKVLKLVEDYEQRELDAQRKAPAATATPAPPAAPPH